MTATMRKIEVEEATATALEGLAAERGISLAELLAEVASVAQSPVGLDRQELAELDRRSAAIGAGGATIAHRTVADWLKTWGARDYKPLTGR